MEQKQQSKSGLVFMEMVKVRQTKNKKSILIFINEKTCISISRKYLEKVLSDNQVSETNEEKEAS